MPRRQDRQLHQTATLHILVLDHQCIQEDNQLDGSIDINQIAFLRMVIEDHGVHRTALEVHHHLGNGELKEEGAAVFQDMVLSRPWEHQDTALVYPVCDLNTDLK